MSAIGSVTNPFTTLGVPEFTKLEGLVLLFNNLLKLTILIGGIYAFLNFIVAGYSFMSAAGTPEKITFAWNKIWHTMIGLLIIAGSFLIAALVGWVVFKDPGALLNIKIYEP